MPKRRFPILNATDASNAAVSKDIDDAVKTKQKLEREGNKKDLADVCNYLGNLYAQAGDHQSALSEHKQELDLCEQTNDKLGVAIAHRKVGECHASLDEFLQAFEHVRAYLALAESLHNIDETERAYMTLGRTHLLQAECMTEFDLDQRNALDRADRSFNAALKLTTSPEMLARFNTQEIAVRRIKLLRNLACVRDLGGETRAAIGELQLAINACEQHLTLSSELIKLHELAAELHRKLGENDEAFNQLDLAIDYVRRSTLSPSHLKQSLRDIYISKMMSALESRKFRTCRHCIKKLVRQYIGSVSRSRSEYQLEKILGVCENVKKTFADMLVVRQRNDYRQALQGMEKLGDVFCSIEAYYAGYDQYKRAFDIGVKLHATPAMLIPLCVSVAQTCMDLCRYDEAVTYFFKELALRPATDHKQRCSTHQSLAVCFARSPTKRAQFIEVEAHLRRALLEAEKAHQAALQIGCLQMLQQYYEIVGAGTWAINHAAASSAIESLRDVQMQLKAVEALAKRKSLRTIVDDDMNNNDDVDDEPSISRENESADNITSANAAQLADLSDISDSENEFECDEDIDSKDDVNTAAGSARRMRSKRILKRNEKGEYPLSVAVIKGNEKLVRKLVEEEGHPVNNCADFAGWLPLHEAANYNHHAIARYLLSKGSRVNADTKENRRTTPLMSAAAGGALETLQTLLDHGADVRRINADNLTAIDHLYMHFDEAKHDGTFRRQPEKLARFFDMQDALVARMRELGAAVDERKIIKRTQYLDDVRVAHTAAAATFVGSDMQGMIANRVVSDEQAAEFDDEASGADITSARKRLKLAASAARVTRDAPLMYQSALMGVGSSAMRRAMFADTNSARNSADKQRTGVASAANEKSLPCRANASSVQRHKKQEMRDVGSSMRQTTKKLRTDSNALSRLLDDGGDDCAGEYSDVESQSSSEEEEIVITRKRGKRLAETENGGSLLRTIDHKKQESVSTAHSAVKNANASSPFKESDESGRHNSVVCVSDALEDPLD